MLRQGDEAELNLQQSAHYYRLAADQGSVQGQLMYANCLIHGVGIAINVKQAANILKEACSHGDCRAHMRYGIALLSGLLGKFDFAEARNLFAKIASSNRFALILRDSLSFVDDEFVSAEVFCKGGNIFSILRDGEISLIRLMNPHLLDSVRSPDEVCANWKNTAGCCITYLLHLSSAGSTSLCSSLNDLMPCDSFEDMIPCIIKLYSYQSSLYRNVNQFLRKFPIQILLKFIKELHGILGYIYLLQLSIEYCAYKSPITADLFVYRGFASKGSELGALDESLIGRIIVWKGFTSTSLDLESVMRQYVQSSEGILFEITLHPGAVAPDISRDSAIRSESEVLIAAMTGFFVESVDYLSYQQKDAADEHSTSIDLTIPRVKLSYWWSWFDFDIDSPPMNLII
jgi:hypothetical protein